MLITSKVRIIAVDLVVSLQQGEARDLLHDLKKLPQTLRSNTRTLVDKLERALSPINQVDKE